jgi:hypothetical protein
VGDCYRWGGRGGFERGGVGSVGGRKQVAFLGVVGSIEAPAEDWSLARDSSTTQPMRTREMRGSKNRFLTPTFPLLRIITVSNLLLGGAYGGGEGGAWICKPHWAVILRLLPNHLSGLGVPSEWYFEQNTHGWVEVVCKNGGGGRV